jgi:hypothetical protein
LALSVGIDLTVTDNTSVSGDITVTDANSVDAGFNYLFEIDTITASTTFALITISGSGLSSSSLFVVGGKLQIIGNDVYDGVHEIAEIPSDTTIRLTTTYTSDGAGGYFTSDITNMDIDLSVTDANSADLDLSVTDNTSILGDITVTDTNSADMDLSVTDSTAISGDITVTDPNSADVDLSVTDNTSISGDITVTDANSTDMDLTVTDLNSLDLDISATDPNSVEIDLKLYDVYFDFRNKQSLNNHNLKNSGYSLSLNGSATYNSDGYYDLPASTSDYMSITNDLSQAFPPMPHDYKWFEMNLLMSMRSSTSGNSIFNNQGDGGSIGEGFYLRYSNSLFDIMRGEYYKGASQITSDTETIAASSLINFKLFFYYDDSDTYFKILADSTTILESTISGDQRITSNSDNTTFGVSSDIDKIYFIGWRHSNDLTNSDFD